MCVRPRSLCQIIQECPLPIPKDDCKGSLPPDYEMKVPKFQNCKKEYPTKNKKPLLFHEKGHLIQGFDRKAVEEIKEHRPKLNFFSMLSQFKDMDEVNKLEVRDVLDIDAELLSEYKTKCMDFIDATGDLTSEKEKKVELQKEYKSDMELMEYLIGKSNEMKQNEINFEIVLNNIEKIKYLCYSENGVQVYFESNE